jgi:hypothetical protein
MFSHINECCHLQTHLVEMTSTYANQSRRRTHSSRAKGELEEYVLVLCSTERLLYNGFYTFCKEVKERQFNGSQHKQMING